MRLRITFAKTEAMRYTGHLDLHRTWERTLRRARLPLAYSQGFKPHPRIVLASALPLGCTSQQEVVDIWLEKQESLSEIATRLNQAAPPGLGIIEVNEVAPNLPSLPSQLEASVYLITFLDPIPDLDSRLYQTNQAPEIPRVWRKKPYDLRALILDLQRLPDDENGCQQILVKLAAREGATGRPEEVASVLGGESSKVRIHRTELIFLELD